MDVRGARGTMGGQELRGQGLVFGIQAIGTPVSSAISTVQQQDYLASVWLRRRERLEHVSFSAQKTGSARFKCSGKNGMCWMLNSVAGC